MLRTTIASTRINEAERKALIKLADMERRNHSEYLRELIRREAKARGVWPATNAA